MNIPPVLVAGDSWSWTDSLGDYPAPIWTLTYTLINAGGKVTITATASGSDHASAKIASETAAVAAGVYTWVARVSDGSTVKTVGTGSVSVSPDIPAASTLDARTAAEKALDAATTLYFDFVSNNVHVLAYTVEGRTMQFASPEQLAAHIQNLKAEVFRERNRARIAEGKNPLTRRTVRFSRNG